MTTNINVTAENKVTENLDTARQYTFSWLFSESSEMKPRGGTTTGQTIALDKSLNKRWTALQEPGLSAFDRDRRAILAMSGGYRTSFDFLETVGFTQNHRPAKPYQSWGTEYVYLVQDKGDFISLQHVMVMYFQGDSELSPKPMVMKHWRQDWHFQDTKLLTYQGFDTWQETLHTTDQVQGKWSQSVYQVDDSPRYQALGHWEHDGNYSSWVSEETWRPLPRREFSVRSDYNVLIGTNRHTITPGGWVQEEENLKAKLDLPGKLALATPILAKELGLARYERIVDHDWKPGDDYWKKTGPFWKLVRDTWRKVINENVRVALDSDKQKESPLFMEIFGLARQFENLQDPGKMRTIIESTISSYLVNPNE